MPLLLSTVIIVRYSTLDQFKKGIPATLAFLITSFLQPDVPVMTDESFGNVFPGFEYGIANERMFYFKYSSLIHWEHAKLMSWYNPANQGRQYRQANKKITKSFGSVGYRGFFAGPFVHIVDFYALTDPLLARIPAIWRPNWRIGHFSRHIPEGYIDSAGSNENKIKDEKLAEFYDHLKVITRGPLFTAERWKDIIKMNLGMYDYLIDKEKYRFANSKIVNYEQLKEEIHNKGSNQYIGIPDIGLEIRFGEKKFNHHIQMELGNNLGFYILFFNDKEFLGRIKLSSFDKRSSTTHTIKVPEKCCARGYDSIRIFVSSASKSRKPICSYMKDIQLLPE